MQNKLYGHSSVEKKLQNDGRKEVQCNLKAYFILYLCIFWVITTVTDESNNCTLSKISYMAS